MDWSVSIGGSNGGFPSLDILAVFLRNPRIAPNLGMYPKLLQIEGCDQREHNGDELIGNGKRRIGQ